MRKYLVSSIFFLFTCFALLLTGCAEPAEPDPLVVRSRAAETGDINIQFNSGQGVLSSGLGFRRVLISRNGDGKIAAIPEASRQYWQFVEWNTNPAEPDLGTTLTLDTVHTTHTTYHAVWENISFDVTKEWDFGNPVPAPGDSDARRWIIDDTNDINLLKTAATGTMLRLYFDARGSWGNRDGMIIGSVGTATTAADADTIILKTHEGHVGMLYDIFVETSWVKEILSNIAGGSTNDVTDVLSIYARTSWGDRLTKIEFLTPKTGFERPGAGGTPAARPTAPPIPTAFIETHPLPDPEATLIKNIEFTFGYFGDKSTGEGSIRGADLESIKSEITRVRAIDKRIIMRVYIRNLTTVTRETWGAGQINGSEAFSGGPANPSGNIATAGNIARDINTAGIEAALVRRPNTLDFTMYNDQIVTFVQLWEVPYQHIKIKITPIAGSPTYKEAEVNFNGGTLSFPENIGKGGGSGPGEAPVTPSGFQFGTTSSGRSNYIWFNLDLGTKKLSNYKEVKITYQRTGGSGSYRLALHALPAATAFSGGLGDHATGGSGQPAPYGSANGWLAANQVSAPTNNGASLNLAGPTDITFKILNSLPSPDEKFDLARAPLATALNSSNLNFAIYESSSGNTHRITGIEFIELDPDECTFCNASKPRPCADCTPVISAARTLINNVGTVIPAATQLLAHNAAAAQAQALVKVNELLSANSITGVTATIIPAASNSYTAAVAGVDGTEAQKLGTNGSYRFTVRLERGHGTALTTNQKQMVITATYYVAPYIPPELADDESLVFDMQMDVADYSHAFTFPNGAISTYNSALFHSNTHAVTHYPLLNPKTLVGSSTRTGTGQGLRMSLGALAAKPGHSYRIEYGGSFSASAVPRFRVEYPSANSAGGNATITQTTVNITDRNNPTNGAPTVAANIPFIVSCTFSQSDVAGWLANGDLGAQAAISFSNASGNDIVITFTTIRIIEIAPPPTDAAKAAIEDFNWTGNPIYAASQAVANSEVTAVINRLRGGIAATVNNINFTAAGASPGSYQFTVTLGGGPDITTTITVPIHRGTVIYNIGTDSNLTRFNGGSYNSSSYAAVNWLNMSSGGGVVANSDGTLTFGTLSGTSQGLIIQLGNFKTTFDIAAKAGYLYRVEYTWSGVGSAIGQFRRAQSGNNDSVVGTNVAGVMTAVVDFTAAQLNGDWAAATAFHFGVNPGAHTGAKLIKFVVIEIPPLP